MPTFAERAATSTWVAAEPGLAAAAVELHDAVGGDHAGLADQAVMLGRFGPVNPVRIARHAAAASVSGALRLATNLPAAVTSRRPLTDPAGFVLDRAVEVFVDQLALGGPAGAELARLITGAGELYPPVLRRELARRDIAPVDLAPVVVQDIVDRSVSGAGPVLVIGPRPVTGTPVSALYPAQLAGEGDHVLVRVRRPGVARDLLDDARLAAGAASVLARLAPDEAGVGPMGFVHLSLRQHLEAVDLRFEALDLVELGMLAEDLGRDGIVVSHPRPGRAAAAALVTERADGVPLARHASSGLPAVDAAAVLPALLGITLEAAISRGVFWADPAPEHVLVRPDGRLALVGAGTVGRFTREQRLAGVRTLRALLTGDHAGMVDGMRSAGVIGPDVDVDALVSDLAAGARLDPFQALRGDDGALLSPVRSMVGIMLAHRIEPPVEVMLLLRTLFATARLTSSLDAGAGLATAMVGLLPRLPGLLAAAEAELG